MKNLLTADNINTVLSYKPNKTQTSVLLSLLADGKEVSYDGHKSDLTGFYITINTVPFCLDKKGNLI